MDSDDVALVADILLRLKYSSKQTPTASSMWSGTKSKSSGIISFRWGRRKARSRPEVKRFAMSKEFKESATRSPTTPLSWSGGCGTSVSGSGNVDGFEASSVMDRRSNGSRSKTYGKLKNEECLLLDERLSLKTDLAKMHASLNHHIMTNQNLKSIKSMNDMHARRVTTTSVVCVPNLKFASATQRPISKAQDSNTGIPKPSISSNNFREAKDNKSFTLPDLNMLPSVVE